MKTTKHTLTPWTVEADQDDDFLLINGMTDLGDEVICQLNNSELEQTNAAHIVKCVNLHEELVEAIEHVINVSAYGDAISDSTEESLKTLLKRAKGKV